MKFTLSWLKDYLATDAELARITDAMILAGLEVEHVTDPREALKQFTVCRIVSARQHPNADKLQVCQVDTVDGRLEIVCGGLNARPGLVTAYAPIGAFIPGSGITLAPKPVRGVVSNGMLCSGGEMDTAEDPFRLRTARFDDWYPRAQALGLDEEKAIADGGIIELPDDAKVGAPVSDVLGATDPVIDFEVTPNRPDWLGMTGIARDLAAKGIGAFAVPKVVAVAGELPCPIGVTIEAPQACPVFAGRLIRGVKNGPSPEWMQQRLKAIGINPKNMLVDVTNYLSFDRARPMHVYDATKLQGDVVARLGLASDTLEALDGKTYTGLTDMCVIADDSGAIGLGGVMGGARTGCSSGTTDVFIECAWFDPDRTAKTGRQTGIISDARFRYERGVDAMSHIDGMELATKLIIETCGGEPSSVVIAGETPLARPPITFKTADMLRLTGVDMAPGRMKTILGALGFDVSRVPTKAAPTWTLGVPSFRPDIAGSADIVEELIRIEGFDALPEAQLPPMVQANRVVVTPLQARVRLSRRVLAARGFLETVTWSFMEKEKAALIVGGNNISDALMIDNPIASDLDYMRPSMLANLAEAAQRNADHGAEEVRLFEAGPIYLGDRPSDQRLQVAAIIRPRPIRNWQGAPVSYDVFAAKADLLALMAALDQTADKFQVGAPEGPHWHPGRAATLRLGPKTIVATFGELHPGFLKQLKCDAPMLAIEVNLEALPQAKAKSAKTKPRLEQADQTPIRRDFAFVVDEKVSAGDIVRFAAKADPKLITGSRAFDVFRGPAIGEGKKSVAIEVTIQPRGETIKDEQIEAIARSVVQSVGKGTGAVLRG